MRSSVESCVLSAGEQEAEAHHESAIALSEDLGDAWLARSHNWQRPWPTTYSGDAHRHSLTRPFPITRSNYYPTAQSSTNLRRADCAWLIEVTRHHVASVRGEEFQASLTVRVFNLRFSECQGFVKGL